MEFSITDLMPAAADIFLLCAVSVILIIDLFVSDQRRIVTYGLTQMALLITALIAASSIGSEPDYGFSDMFVGDSLRYVMKTGVCLTVVVGLAYSGAYLAPRGMYRGEYFVLAMLAVLGMMAMTSANHLLVLYLGLELLSLSPYSMVALARDPARSTEGAMKYFVLGALASGMLLYGMSMIYGATGSLGISDIADVIQQGEANLTILKFGLVFVVAGIGFEFGAVPFHMWVPDVYQGARSPVTLYIGSAPKLAALALTLRILVDGLGELHVVWADMLMIVAVLSLVLGNVIAIAQTNIKRMLAYSTIAHVGFILLSVQTGTEQGYSAALFYTLTYVVAAAGAFGMIILLSRRGYEAENLSDFKGLNARSPWFALMMMFLMFSMAGIPPLVGFFGKLNVINAVLTSGYTGLAVIMVLASVVGAYYYLRIIWYMYFEDATDKAVLQASTDTRIVLSLNGLAVVGLGILPGWLWALCLEVM